MPKNKLLISTISIFTMLSVRAGTAKTETVSLANILTKYCVPKDTFSCDTRAVYTEDAQTENKCYCGGGKFYNVANRNCETCLKGTFSEGFEVNECISCPKGQYAPSDGSESCSSCPKGQYSNTEGASSCSLCPPGQYTSSAGGSSCSLCPAGQYNNVSGGSSCVECPDGEYNPNPGGSSCQSIPQNTTQSCSYQCFKPYLNITPEVALLCCGWDLGATCGVLATALAVGDVGTFTATLITPTGACLIGAGAASMYGECSGSQSVTYSVNSTKTGYDKKIGDCN